MVDLAINLFTHSSVCETPRIWMSIKHKGLTFGNFGKHSTRKGFADQLCKSPLLKGVHGLVCANKKPEIWHVLFSIS